MPKAKIEKLEDVNDDSQPSIMDAVIDADPSKGSAARPLRLYSWRRPRRASC